MTEKFSERIRGDDRIPAEVRGPYFGEVAALEQRVAQVLKENGALADAISDCTIDKVALEQQVERLEKDRDYCVTWLYANINDPGLLQHFERARTLAVEEEA